MKRNRAISNLVCFRGQWMTELDKKVRIAYQWAKKDDIMPRRVDGRLVGYYIVYRGDDSSSLII